MSDCQVCHQPAEKTLCPRCTFERKMHRLAKAEARRRAMWRRLMSKGKGYRRQP
ncbi:hypothetical protein GCM10027053_46400 [Intrasporangium mesophilum]